MNRTSMHFDSNISRLSRRLPLTGNDDDEDEDQDMQIALDEQEQEELIQKLQTENEHRNAFYMLAFTCLSLLPCILHILRIFYGNFALLDVLALSSYLISTYVLRCVPFDRGSKTTYLSPTERFLPYLNPLLIFVISLNAYITRRVRFSYDKEIWALPFIVWFITTLGRYTMASVDITELEKLKYKYKGA